MLSTYRLIDFSEVELDSPMRDVAKLLSVLLFQLTSSSTENTTEGVLFDSDEALEDGRSLIDALLETAKQQGIPTVPAQTIRSMKTAPMRMISTAFSTILRLVWCRLQDAGGWRRRFG